MKKGFTLIELLAVIIILSLLMIVAVPNVLSTMNSAKRQSFVTQTQSIFKIAQQQWTKDSMKASAKQLYSDSGDKLDLSKVAANVKYCVKFNADGTIQKLIVDDGTFHLETGSSIANLKTENVTSSTGEVNCGSGSGGSGGTVYVDSVLPVAPDLGNLIPVKYNGSNWVYADITQEWYNYADKEWANAVVLTAGVTKSVNDIISESEIDLWYVWIPRFEYKIPTESIGSQGTPKAVEIKFISGSKTSSSSGYSLHPGFAWDSNWADGISEWKNGIWVGKFESTAANATSNSIQKVKVKANTVSWRNVLPGNAYNSSLNIKTDYSLTGIDSHMTKYTEWTAVTYLANSIYGRCSNANTCTEVSRNSDSTYLTGGGNYVSNASQSTTGNVYGIYDMRGGAYERVMGYKRGYVSASGAAFTTVPTDHKYADLFETSGVYGAYYGLTQINGITSMNGVYKEIMNEDSTYYVWYGDYMRSVMQDYPFYIMGGRYDDTTSQSGIFAAEYNGTTSDPSIGFRTTLVNE